ncbi:MAG: hypothetical protein ACI84O_001635, partial [Myxococcota bacterium]
VDFSNAGYTRNGTTIELSSNFNIFAQGTTNAAGGGSKFTNVPPAASGLTAYFEVVTVGAQVESSNLLRVSVL